MKRTQRYKLGAEDILKQLGDDIKEKSTHSAEETLSGPTEEDLDNGKAIDDNKLSKASKFNNNSKGHSRSYLAQGYRMKLAKAKADKQNILTQKKFPCMFCKKVFPNSQVDY